MRPLLLRTSQLLALTLLVSALHGPAGSQVVPAPAVLDIFPPDTPGVLARFEMNGDVQDSSGNNRHGVLLGGRFVSTCFGQGLQTRYERATGAQDATPMGFSWPNAGLLKHPYTVEFVLRPDLTAPWGKLFGFDDVSDSGWYYFQSGFQDYPKPVVGAGQMQPGSVHYLALVSLSNRRIAVWFNGTKVGETDTTFTSPPSQAIFFRDDTDTSRTEQFTGIIDAVRLSNVARTADEIRAQHDRIATRLHTPEDGIETLGGTPAEGAATGTLHETAEPALEPVSPEAAGAVHAASCALAPIEDQVAEAVGDAR